VKRHYYVFFSAIIAQPDFGLMLPLDGRQFEIRGGISNFQCHIGSSILLLQNYPGESVQIPGRDFLKVLLYPR